MVKKRKLMSSVLGIPLWVISGIALFVLFSAIYDFIVLDRSFIRYGLIFGAAGILLISVGLKLLPMKFIANQAKKQMGG